MADDNAVADQTASDTAFDGGFEEEVKTDSASGAEAKIDEGDKGKEPVAKVDQAGAEAAEDKLDQAKEAEGTAQSRMEARAKEIEAAAGQPVQPVQTVKTAAPVRPEPVQQSTAEEPAAGIDWIGALIKTPEVGNLKVGSGDDGMTIAQFAKEYPEAVSAPVAIAKVMIDQVVGQIESRHAAEMQGVKAQVANLQFWDGVRGAHSDAKQVAASKEFREWRSKQSALIEKLCVSTDPSDGISVLDAFKESLAKGVKRSRDGVAQDRKDKRDALHGESLRGQSGAQVTPKDQDDFDAGFGLGKQ